MDFLPDFLTPFAITVFGILGHPHQYMILYYFYSRRVCSYKRTDASNGVDVKGQTFGGEVSSGPMLPAVI
ncbi:MAG: hypothetical protein ALECFALPRED_002341, partial [Alectoria fallacina]